MERYAVPAALTAAQLKEKRRALGLTQKDFAALIGVSKPTVERWEVSDKPITGPVVLLLQLLTPADLEGLRIPPKKLPLRLGYYYREQLCTLIDVDEGAGLVEVRNYTENRQFRAFGAVEHPTFEEYENFLKSRCFPEERDGIKLILRDLGLPFYDPLMIIQKTEGRMAEDEFWVKVDV